MSTNTMDPARERVRSLLEAAGRKVDPCPGCGADELSSVAIAVAEGGAGEQVCLRCLTPRPDVAGVFKRLDRALVEQTAARWQSRSEGAQTE